MEKRKIESLSRLIRYYILKSTTMAGSGHPTSSLSAVELIAVLFFGGFFRFIKEDPDFKNNDRLIFSKGHASPLLYSIWAAAGTVSEEKLLTLRRFGSDLEGHPTPKFKYAKAATGSLGQGLSIGLGMALAAKYLDRLSYNTYVLLGDSEMTEGSQWESMQIASHYKLDNLIGMIDVNRLGQRGETMYGADLYSYERKISSFGWKTIIVNDGHNIEEINAAYKEALNKDGKPSMIIAKTIKGKGVSFIEDKEGWHGKILDQEQCRDAIKELGSLDKEMIGDIASPDIKKKSATSRSNRKTYSERNTYTPGDMIPTRKAYGDALTKIADDFPLITVLDAEVSNSTYSEIFKKKYPERFFEMYIGEQNMVGAALGLSLRGKIPFISTFAAFFTRAYDQIRMSQYSDANIKFTGSHAGVSIGPDGASQMGLEDISMFRSLYGCTVFYPSDAVSTEAIVRIAAGHKGNVYIRTTRMDTPVIYKNSDRFKIGGSHTIKSSKNDRVTIIAAGITLYETLKAYEDLIKENINIKVIDLYCIKPLDEDAIISASKDTAAIITVEDHFPSGGLGEAVKSIDDILCPVHIMAVNKIPGSGKPDELLDYEEISKKAIINKVKEILAVS